jgi:hypothetical protein
MGLDRPKSPPRSASGSLAHAFKSTGGGVAVGGLKPSQKAKLLTLDAIDGRTTAARSTRELLDAIESDLGGPGELSAGERQIAQRAAVSGAILESMEAAWLAGGELDAATYVSLGNNQRRYFQALGLKRRPRDVTPTLSQYLEAKKHEATE